MATLGVSFWVIWAVVLLAQNFSFTFVSRARNSGSLKRHVVASIMSNGVWFASQCFAVSAFMKIISGAFGTVPAILAAVFYTAFTVAGSIAAHYVALRTEKGKAAVGANKRFAQIPVEEWERLKADYDRIVNGLGEPRRQIVMEGVQNK